MQPTHPYEIGGVPNHWYIRHVDTGKTIAWAKSWDEAVRRCDFENAAALRNAGMMGVAANDT